MSDEGKDSTPDVLDHGNRPPDPTPGHDDVYLYRASGLQERHGAIPWWLKAVSIGLIAWGIYYTIRYWASS